jgi:phage terminase large subunit-like protein
MDPTGWSDEDRKIKAQKQISTAASILHRKIAERAHEDFNVFMEFVFRVKQADCHRTMVAHMMGPARAGIVAQKEIGKTTQAVGYILWCLGRNPDLLIKLVCCSDDTAKDRIGLLRDMISRNKYLRMVFPGLVRNPWIDDWTKQSLTVKRDIFSKDSSIEACGVLTTGTGARADLILFDDVVDLQNAVKFPTQRKQVKEAFKNVWIPLLGPTGRAIYLATLHHEDDLTCEIQKNPEWSWIDLSVTGDPPVSRWPQKWPPHALLRRQSEIGSIEFDRTMRNILHPDKERIVQQGWIRKFSGAVPRGNVRYSSWDFAASGGEGDWTARTVLDVYFQERLMRVRRIDRWRGLTYNQMIDGMISDFAEHKPTDILIETTGFQVIMGRDERMVLYPIRTITPAVSKEQRVRQTAVLYERGFILFEDGFCDGGVGELLGFPKVAHDDRVDALTQAVLHGMEKIGKVFNPEGAQGHGQRVFGVHEGTGTEAPRARAIVDVSSRSPRTRAGFGETKW